MCVCVYISKSEEIWKQDLQERLSFGMTEYLAALRPGVCIAVHPTSETAARVWFLFSKKIPFSF